MLVLFLTFKRIYRLENIHLEGLRLEIERLFSWQNITSSPGGRRLIKHYCRNGGPQERHLSCVIYLPQGEGHYKKGPNTSIALFYKSSFNTEYSLLQNIALTLAIVATKY